MFFDFEGGRHWIAKHQKLIDDGGVDDVDDVKDVDDAKDVKDVDDSVGDGLDFSTKFMKTL